MQSQPWQAQNHQHMPAHTKKKQCRRRSEEKKRAERLANADGGRREPKWPKILNFTTLGKYSFDDALIILIVILRFEISSRKLEMRLKWLIRILRSFILFVCQYFKWMCQYLWNRKTFDLLPKGRPEKKDGGDGKPQGLMRGLAGAADWMTGGIFDFDKRGSMVDGVKTMMGGGGGSSFAKDRINGSAQSY